MDSKAFTLEIKNSISEIDAAVWNSLAGADNPFVQHQFLSALEDSKAVGGSSGWEIMHISLSNSKGELVGVMPHYLKHHSYGEYVFDHGWANAYENAGGKYYPKLLSAVPFTPATGPRLLVKHQDWLLKSFLARGLTSLADNNHLSSAHINNL